MSELGQYLKGKREEQGLSLEKLQEMTKIQIRYLRAIEEENYDALPGAFYARAFVKSYSEAIGLDVEQVFEEYGDSLPRSKQQVMDLPSRSERRRPAPKRKSPKKWSLLPGIMVILFVMVVAIGLWVVIQGTGNSGSTGTLPEDDQSFEVDSNDQIQDESEAEGEELDGTSDGNEETSHDEETEEGVRVEEDEATEETEQEIELVGTENRQSTFELFGADELVIELEFTGNSYVEVQNEEGDVVETVHSSEEGDSERYDLSELNEVMLNIGNSSAIHVFVNGHELEFPIDPSEMPHQRLILKRDVE